MAFHSAAILSGLAYLALCLLAAGARLGATFPRSVAQPERKDHRAALACLIALPAWLGIPPGTLPAFLPTDWSGAAALACPACSLWLASGRRIARDPEGRALLRLGLALAACAWYARQRGVPGGLLSLDTYVGLPLAGVTEGCAGAGLALLALATLPPPGNEAGNEAENGAAALARSLRHLAGLAVWTCLFLPACPARDLGLEGVAAFVLDALYFWGKLLLLDHALRLLARHAPARPPAARPKYVWADLIRTGCAGAGAVLLICG